jgi:5-methylcytosine-specific restriction endonuclease McrA
VAKPGLRARARILDRYGRRCVYCGAEFRPEDLTIDHVEPLRIGGDQSEGNLVTSCRPCNRDKGGEAAWRYLARHPDKRETFLALATGVWPRLRRAIIEAAPANESHRRDP